MDAVRRLRDICLDLPDATEKRSHGEPTFFARKVFAQVSDHHHDDRVGFWCAAPPGAQEAFVASDPERFYVPPYVGGKGWIGVYLDVAGIDWDEIAELVEESYRMVASKWSIAKLDDRAVDPAVKTTVYDRIGEICMALPEVVNEPFGGHTSPAYRVRGKIFVGTAQTGRPRIDLKGAPGAQEALIASDPDRYFVPAYSGPKGWIGAWLDVDPNWDEIAELCEESYRLVAPKRLVAQLDADA